MRKLIYLLLLFPALAFSQAQTEYQIKNDTVQIKKSVTPAVGNMLVCVDTFGDYVTVQGFAGALDSVATSGATISPLVNTAFHITASGTISILTLTFPAGITGNWLIGTFDQAVTTLTNSGTGSGTVTLVAPTKGLTHIYQNNGGNWH